MNFARAIASLHASICQTTGQRNQYKNKISEHIMPGEMSDICRKIRMFACPHSCQKNFTAVGVTQSKVLGIQCLQLFNGSQACCFPRNSSLWIWVERSVEDFVPRLQVSETHCHELDWQWTGLATWHGRQCWGSKMGCISSKHSKVEELLFQIQQNSSRSQGALFETSLRNLK